MNRIWARTALVAGIALVVGCAAIAIVGLIGTAKVAPVEVGAYLAYLALVVVAPGTALWWMLRLPGWDRPGQALVLGTVLGSVVELVGYLCAAALHRPAAVWALPVLTIVIVVARTARTARTARATRVAFRRRARPTSCPWSVPIGALAVIALLVQLIRGRWAAYPATTIGAVADRDEGFQLALTGELMHHVGDLQFPYVAGTPLQYHWGVFANLASGATATGIEASTIVRVLAPSGYAVLLLLVLGVVTSRISRVPGSGSVAMVLAVLASLPDPYGWTNAGSPVLGALLPVGELFASPSQALGCALLLVALLLTTEVVAAPGGAGDRRTVGARLAALAVLAAGLALVKAPLFTALVGALVLLAGCALVARRARVITIALAGGSLVLLAIVTAVVYGGSARGTAFDPGQSVWSVFATVTGPTAPGTGVGAVLVVAVLALMVAMYLPWVGLREPGDLVRWLPAACLAAVAIGGWLVLGHVYLSQFYLLHAANLLSAASLGTLVVRSLSPATSVARRGARVGSIVVVLVVAVVGMNLLARITARVTGALPTGSAGTAVMATLVPVVLAAGLAVAIGGGLLFAAARAGRNSGAHRLRVGRSRSIATGVVAVLLATMLGYATSSAAGLTAPPFRAPVTDAIGPGGVDAARWLRDRSTPADLVATNAHCFSPTESPCRSQNFWMAGLTERRLLVEGWGFVPRPELAGTILDSDSQPFWDPDLLARNDAAFTSPSPTSIGALRALGVRWLLVDTRFPCSVSGLRANAEIVHETGDYLVVRL